jgi:hypothetical protein
MLGGQVTAAMADRQVRIAADARDERGHGRPWVFGVSDEMQDPAQHDRGRPGQVEGLCGAGQDPGWVAEVRVKVGAGSLGGAGQQRAGVSEDELVVVDVDDARLRCECLRYLVHAAR